MSDRNDWREYYENDGNGLPRRPAPEPDRPEWSRRKCVETGQDLAVLFATDRIFGDRFLDIVQKYYGAGQAGDFTTEYRKLIFAALPARAQLPFNEHDFANLYRAAWLWLLEGFARLVNHNPHQPDGWGNPLPGDISNGKHGVRDYSDDGQGAVPLFHNVPNGPGYYAINTTDIPAPVVTGLDEQ